MVTLMERYLVSGGNRLVGTVRIAGATKNSGLKHMAAALLARGRTRLSNMPPVSDLEVMITLFERLGASVEWTGDEEITVDTTAPIHPVAPAELVTKMRASINVLGPLLARYGRAEVALPGGDNIGTRRIDMHLRGLQDMGAEVEVRDGFVVATAEKLVGARHVLDFPSVGATENLLTAATLAKGTTVIDNAAREPEITDLAAFLNRMGAHILGAGSSTIEVEGVDELSSTDAHIMGDRIEAGTFLMACGAAGGELLLEGTKVEHLEMVVLKLGDMGLRVSPAPTGIWVRADERLRACDIATLPFPGFATDFMPMAVALLCVADGPSIVTENVYDNRLAFVDELARLGADIRAEGRHAVIRGVDRLHGGEVRAHDVRAGAALVVAALAAEGETVVSDVHHVERGYPRLPERLAAVGGRVERLD